MELVDDGIRNMTWLKERSKHSICNESNSKTYANTRFESIESYKPAIRQASIAQYGFCITPSHFAMRSVSFNSPLSPPPPLRHSHSASVA